MRAAFLTGLESVEVRDVAEPGIDPGLVAVDVIACGVCGSDLHGWRHPEQTVAAGGAVLPGIGGHEVVGRVAPDGRRVVVEPNLAGSCGVCEPCRAGTAWFCRDRRSLPSWGFSERMHVRPEGLFSVPDGVPDAVAALTEPLACGVHALRASHTTVRNGGNLGGRRVAVIGAGAAGLLVVAAARAMGADAISSVARYPHQAEAAGRLGAAEVHDSAEDGLRKNLSMFRPDVVVEAVGGTADTFNLAVGSVRTDGEVVVLGLFDEPQQLDARRAIFRELRMFFPVTYGMLDGRHDFEVALEILGADSDAFAPLVSHRFALSSTAEAFATAADKRERSVKVVVEP
jgi:threonine dehydrogenase-like Zn-dependent dehydrogenase